MARHFYACGSHNAYWTGAVHQPATSRRKTVLRRLKRLMDAMARNQPAPAQSPAQSSAITAKAEKAKQEGLFRRGLRKFLRLFGKGERE